MSADYNLVPHLSHRELIYTFPNPWISSNYGVDGRGLPDPATVEWIAVDINLLDLASRTMFDQLFAAGSSGWSPTTTESSSPSGCALPASRDATPGTFLNDRLASARLGCCSGSSAEAWSAAGG